MNMRTFRPGWERFWSALAERSGDSAVATCLPGESGVALRLPPQSKKSPWPGCQVAPSAFSLIEILVTVTLLTVIILGLLAMFNQTQRAFRQGTTQTDVLESGRSAMDLIRRELEQMTPAYLHVTNNFANFYVSDRYQPDYQRLPPVSSGK